jgi:hypothetical protein
LGGRPEYKTLLKVLPTQYLPVTCV